MSSLRRQGFDVRYQIPEIPKRVTEGSVRRLKKITAREIRENSYWTDDYTLEEHKASERWKLKRYREKAKKDIELHGKFWGGNFYDGNEEPELAALDRAAIDNFLREIHLLNVPEVTGMMQDFINVLRIEIGEERLAKILEWSASLGYSLSVTEEYDPDKNKRIARAYISKIVSDLGMEPFEENELISRIDRYYD